MRNKDPHKIEALFHATTQVVNEIGFSASSVSKIAKAAKVSPATIYTYFESKDDLIIHTFEAITEKMCENYFIGLNIDAPVKESLHLIWFNIYRYISKNREDYLFTEQFSKSPYVLNVDLESHKKFFAPMSQVIKKGIEQCILKDEHFHLHALYFYYPILTLANPNSCHSVQLEDTIIEKAFEFAWDAIKI